MRPFDGYGCDVISPSPGNSGVCAGLWVVILMAAPYGLCDAKRWRTVTVGLFEIGNVWFWGSGCYRCKVWVIAPML